MSWYNKIDKKARGSGGIPLMDDPNEGYKKSKPGDQNGGGGVSNKATHGLGDSGYGGHSRTDGRNVGEVGVMNDDHEDTVPEFGSSHDYGKGTGDATGNGNSDLSSQPWMSDDEALGSQQKMLDGLNSLYSDNPDSHPSALNTMRDGGYKGEVFEELRKRRQK